MEIKRYARRRNEGFWTLLKDSDKKKAERVWDARKGESHWSERKAEWGWSELDERSEERSGGVLSLSVQDVEEPYSKKTPYNYTINLSLDDLVEIIGALSRDAVYKSRPALQKALGSHVSKLLAITLAASDYPSPNDDTEAVTQGGDDSLGRVERRDAFSVITQDGDDTLIDLRAHGCGTVRLKNFSVYELDDDWDKDFVDIHSVITQAGDDTLIDLRAHGCGTVRLKNFFAHDDLLHGEDFVFVRSDEEA